MLTKGERLTEDMCYNAWLNILRNPLSCAKELDILESLIKEHFNPNPYKYEDLKEDMWVWDNQLKWFFEVGICKVEIEGYEFLKLFKVKNFDGSLQLMIFEEGRFFPIIKAREYQEEYKND